MRHPLDIFSDRRPLFDIVNEMDRMFGSPSRAEVNSFKPACDVQENEEFYLFSFDLPGISKDDIKVEVTDQRLAVSGERKRQGEGRAQHRTERFFGRFERMFELPRTADLSKLEAQYENGVLQLLVPKTGTSKSRSVEIQSGSNRGFLDRLIGHKTEQKQDKSNLS